MNCERTGYDADDDDDDYGYGEADGDDDEDEEEDDAEDDASSTAEVAPLAPSAEHLLARALPFRRANDRRPSYAVTQR